MTICPVNLKQRSVVSVSGIDYTVFATRNGNVLLTTNDGRYYRASYTCTNEGSYLSSMPKEWEIEFLK